MTTTLKLITLGALLFTLSGCSDNKDNNAALAGADAETVTPEKSANAIALYTGTRSPSWNISFHNNEQNQLFSGAEATLPDGSVTLKTGAHEAAADALHISWKEARGAGVVFDGKEPLDLRDYLAHGVVSLDINVIELAQGGVAFRLQCGADCEHKVPFTEPAFKMMGAGWQTIRVPLSCFAQDGDDYSAITLPFAVETSGSGELAMANIQLLKNAQGNVDCPDYKTVAVSPSMLNEFWARDWWEARHQEKLQRVKEGNVDLLMIGDSITQDWEAEGKAVWEEYYAPRNAVNLGFSGDRTENVLWRLAHGEVDNITPKLAVLMIGTNNTGHRLENPEYTANGIKTIVQELRTRLPETKILLLGIFPREENPDGKMRQINREINNIIATYADDEAIFFLDIGDQFLDDNGVLARDVMPDLLHLNAASYATWAAAMEPKIKELLGE